MVAYNFKKEFVPVIANGNKRQTVRPRRKRPTVPGDKLQLYTGMRTKKCQLIKEVVCKQVRPTILHGSGILYDGEMLLFAEIEQFVEREGFFDFGEMIRFFYIQYGLPFKGETIRW